MPGPPRLRGVGELPEELGGEAFSAEAGANGSEEWEDTPLTLADETAVVHECFLEEMAATHGVFLRHFGGVGSANLGPVPAEVVDVEVDHAVVGAALERAGVEPEPAAPETAGGRPVGPRFSRAQLEHLASGRISEMFGPAFAGQDHFHRQVRMPMPPMLLADRVTGIDAVPGELGPGTIWTETDVRPDAWYLHDGCVPLGITIEAGQADLLLISWMGIDALNRSERTYRLLGCEAEVKGPPPKVGDTLQFDIHIEGHAQLGGIRMFFFHSDLRVNGEVRLSVRHGQAGFFTDEELANSDGVLWDATTEPAPPWRRGGQPARPALTTRRAFDAAQVRAFSEGRTLACFGPGFERTETHTRTPRIQPGRMCLLDEVTALDATGGPWGRGYLRAVKAIAPDLWFFEGHFKNDPCMPGTLMLEGAVQALAFFMAALGCTVRRDGWRFEPAKNENMLMRCRGQCVPGSRELVYEVFVEEFIDEAVPHLRATVMASVDGRKAFLCQGLAIELVQDWPLAAMLRCGDVVATTRGACFARGGFGFDHRSLLACALGRPSESFGPTFAASDGPLLLPRLPRPPYHFMTRIVACTGEIGRPQPGMAMECDYDFAAGDWFFEPSGNRTMPACIFMEALLQPCGWLSSYARDASGQTTDIFFRNLDGTLTWTEELRPHDGTLRVRTELTKWSELGTMIIVGFRVEARLGGRIVANMETAFGFFPGDAFANQVGLAPSATEREFFARASDGRWRLRGADAEAFPLPGAVLAGEPLLMLDRVTGWWPQAGEAGLGLVRAEKDVTASEWFFKAHFMQDPVQPGSLGIEALLQLLQCALRLRGVGSEWGSDARFEPIAIGEPVVWKYRGQVVPTNRLITTLVELIAIDESVPGAITVRARGSLWVDGKKIYEAGPLAMRVRSGDGLPAAARARVSAGSVEKEFSLAEMPWLHDHRPSFTSAVIPLTVMLDELVAAAGPTGMKLIEIGAFAPARWLVCGANRAAKIRIEVDGPGGDGARTAARLSVWREAKRADLSRYDEVGATTLGWAAAYPEPPAALPALAAPLVASPYVTGETTHGPAFHVLTELRRSAEGASCQMDAGAGSVPRGKIHPALLDGCTHAVPLSDLSSWYPGLAEHWNGLPRGVQSVRFFGETPTEGPVRCEIRPRGLAPETGLPVVYVQFIAGDRVWCDLFMEFALLDARPLVGATFAARRAFMRGEEYQNIRFSAWDGVVSTWSAGEIARYAWMPGQLESLFKLPEARPAEQLALAITAQEHVAHLLAVHPATVAVNAEHTRATSPHFPLQAWPIAARVEGGRVEVRSAGEPIPVSGGGGGLFGSAFLEDLSRALRQSYVRHFRLIDPAALEPLKARPFVICANHQTAIESMLFTDLFSRWAGLPVTTVTRTEHAGSWMGRLTDFLWRHPRRSVAVNPQLLFDRDQPGSFLEIMAGYKAAQAAVPHSLHLHVEGEQALSCRHRVKRMSAVIVDLAIDLDVPILPLRYGGGLPVEPLAGITSFPFEFGQQDYVLGRPLLPDDLRRMPRPKAAEWVVDTINQMPPALADEKPLPGPSQRAGQVRALSAVRQVTEIQAAVIVALQALVDPSETTRSVLNYPAGGVGGLVAPADELAWHREVAGWLWSTDESARRESEHWKKTAKV
jgi:3-hydroxymyristoyl/3-hydroxydecanoyl-(acyl carrier protein) dehydratase